MTAALACARVPLPELHARFQIALPAVEGLARRAFRRVRCPHARADAVAEAVLCARRQFLRPVTGAAPAVRPRRCYSTSWMSSRTPGGMQTVRMASGPRARCLTPRGM